MNKSSRFTLRFLRVKSLISYHVSLGLFSKKVKKAPDLHNDNPKKIRKSRRARRDSITTWRVGVGCVSRMTDARTGGERESFLASSNNKAKKKQSKSIEKRNCKRQK